MGTPVLKKILIIILLVLATICPATGKETIIWPYLCFKPVYICQDETLVDGSGYHILNLMWENLADYDHEPILMPIQRILEFAKKGKHQLFYGLYKTPEREKFLYFSLPCRISTPTYVVVRKEDLPKFGHRRQVSLQALLENKNLTFLHLKSISFGKGIDELLEKYKGGENILTEYDTENLIKKSLKLLMAGRIDYMLSVDGTRFDASDLGVQDKIAFISIKEQNHYDIGYIAAPKTEWGKALIDRINKVLKQEVPKESFFRYFTPLVDEAMVPTLRKYYEQNMVQPVKAAQ